MAFQPLKGLPRVKAALANSMQGLRDIWRMEEAFRLEAIATLLSFPLAFLVADTLFQGAVLVGSLVFLLIVEVLNSAIEAVVDRIGAERHELSRIAKDYGSLAVLLAMGLVAILWAAAVISAIIGTA
ncbi:MAG: diacylglycerol kinase [Silicimonas sp.]|nr:diacylglycerol kinase [Silicimonas sp.]